MSTEASAPMEELWKLISKSEKRAVLGGIVGNQAHQEEDHSYHESWDDQKHDGGYTVHFYADTHIPKHAKNKASAIDISLPPHLMIKYTKRLKRWARLKRLGLARMNLGGVLMEFAGTLDGRVVFSMDTHAKPFVTTGFNSSHLHHNHLSVARCYADDPRVLLLAQIYTDSWRERAAIRKLVANRLKKSEPKFSKQLAASCPAEHKRAS